MNTLTNTIILAAGEDGFDMKVGTVNFWDTSMGGVLKTIMGIVGIIVVIYAILKAVKNIATGKVADGVKAIVAAILVAAVLFNPMLIESGIRAGGKVIESVLKTVNDVAGSGSKTNTGGSGSDLPDK